MCIRGDGLFDRQPRLCEYAFFWDRGHKIPDNFYES